ncbi:MAG TPA: SgcJ/EcaC family oxidoreductase [Actinomycetota bacterium]|nr:SgcJ/EcaC family oxidoreductase [Actinomycetota bacterium]
MRGQEREIRAVEDAYDAAWNAGDVASLIACFADDAVLVNPRGERAIGHAEIQRQLGAFLEGEARGWLHFSDLMSIWFVTPDVAVVDGEARLGSALGGGSVRHRFTDVLVRRDGRWVIAHVRAYGLRS